MEIKSKDGLLMMQKKELEKLVKVQGRSRLISRHSLMGKEEH